MTNNSTRKTNQQIWKVIADIKAQIAVLQATVKRLMENDLEHIQKGIDLNARQIDKNHEKTSERLTSIERKLALIFGGLAVLQIIYPLVLRLLSI